MFGHVAVSASAMLVRFENRWDIQNSCEGRILASRGRVPDGSVAEIVDGVSIVRAAKIVATSGIWGH